MAEKTAWEKSKANLKKSLGMDNKKSNISWKNILNNYVKNANPLYAAYNATNSINDFSKRKDVNDFLRPGLATHDQAAAVVDPLYSDAPAINPQAEAAKYGNRVAPAPVYDAPPASVVPAAAAAPRPTQSAFVPTKLARRGMPEPTQQNYATVDPFNIFGNRNGVNPFASNGRAVTNDRFNGGVVPLDAF